MSDEGLETARAAAGGKNVDLARLLGITESAVSQWKVVPPDRAIEIEQKTGGKVTRHQIRPDYFGPPPAGQPLATPEDPPTRRRAATSREAA